MNMMYYVQMEHLRNGQYYTLAIPSNSSYKDAVEVCKLFIDELNAKENEQMAQLKKQQEEEALKKKEKIKKQMSDNLTKKEGDDANVKPS